MNDGARVYPVNKVVMHHAVSDDMVDWDDLKVQDWFSAIGKARGYSNGAIDSLHEHPSRPGQQTYAMAHFALHRYRQDDNKYGWRLTTLIKDPWNQVAWGAGNWAVNQQAINIETAGNYLGAPLDEKALMLVADTFRAQDKALGGGLEIYPHQAFFATQCPGQIAGQIDTLIDMINDPGKWNDRLWPAPAPAPAPAPKPEPVVVSQTFSETFPSKRFVVKKDTHLKNMPDASDATNELYAVGRTIENVVERVGYSNGLSFLRTSYSKDHNIARGFLHDTLEEVVAPSPQPAPEPTPAPTTPDPIPVDSASNGTGTGPAPGQENSPTPSVPVTPAETTPKAAWWLVLLAALLQALTRKKKS